MDTYASYDNFKRRLNYEYYEYGKLIIAVDFDSTIFPYHKDTTCYDVIRTLERWSNHAYIYIFTARSEDKYEEIYDYCSDLDINFRNINVGSSEVDFGGRKPFYNLLLDDRAGLDFGIRALNEIMDKIEGGR